jgi:uncharacterized protein YodC (DUF2158 family)
MFKVGDVVVLKSGGPQMTVDEIRTSKSVHCMWFNDEERKGNWFDIVTIEHGDRTPMSE